MAKSFIELDSNDLRGSGDLIESITFKVTHELHSIIAELSQGNTSEFVREACIESVLRHQLIAKRYVKAFGLTTETKNTV